MPTNNRSNLTTSRLYLLLLAGCSAPTERPPVSEWPLSAAVLSIGAEDSPLPELELAQVSSAIRLGGGRLAIANSGTSEIRFFDSAGTFIRSSGRRGQGPGEYSGRPLYISERGSDTLLVYDVGTNRLTALDSSTRLIASVQLLHPDTLPAAWVPRLFPNAFLAVDEARNLRPCTSALLTRLATRPGRAPPLLARVDQLGYLWVSDLPHPVSVQTSWQVYDLDGTLTGQATLPSGFTPFAIGRNDILGLLVDSLGVERIVIHPIRRPSTPRRICSQHAAEPPYADSAAFPVLRQAGRSAIEAQEVFFSDHATYTTSPDSLRLPELAGLTFVILTSDRQQWFGLLIDPKTRATCAIGVGYQPPGWDEAVARCVTSNS